MNTIQYQEVLTTRNIDEDDGYVLDDMDYGSADDHDYEEEDQISDDDMDYDGDADDHDYDDEEDQIPDQIPDDQTKHPCHSIQKTTRQTFVCVPLLDCETEFS